MSALLTVAIALESYHIPYIRVFELRRACEESLRGEPSLAGRQVEIHMCTSPSEAPKDACLLRMIDTLEYEPEDTGRRQAFLYVPNVENHALIDVVVDVVRGLVVDESEFDPVY